MFVILRIIEPEKSYFKARKQIRNTLRSPAVIHKENGALPFCTVDIIRGKRGIIWDGTEEKCGRYASRIIAPKSIHLPDGGNLKRYVPSAIKANLIFNTAKSIIEKTNAEPDSFCITVTDKNALLPSKICSLLPYCSCIRVITAREDKYAVCAENALNSFGATLIFRTDYEPTAKPDIVICCDGITSAAMSEAAVFTFKKRACGKLRFCGSGIALTPEHADFLPDGVDPLDFAGALTELCGCRDYNEACFSELGISCGKCAEPKAESCLLCHIRSSAGQ